MLTELKREAYEANLALPKHGLINLTFGNASAIDRRKGVFAIKPSGVAYEDLKVSDIVLIDLDGRKVEGKLNPSSDTPTHRRLFRAFPAECSAHRALMSLQLDPKLAVIEPELLAQHFSRKHGPGAYYAQLEAAWFARRGGTWPPANLARSSDLLG